MEIKIGKICSFVLTVLLVYNTTSQFSSLLELITSASTVFLATNDDRYRSVFVMFSLVIYAIHLYSYHGNVLCKRSTEEPIKFYVIVA